MLRIAIAEDNSRDQEILQSYLSQYQREHGEDMQITVYSDEMSLAEQYQPVYDLLLLDIEMPGLDGMSAAEWIRRIDKEVLILFITNMAQYALRGYQVDAVDYVLKPVSYFAFALKLEKVRRILAHRSGVELLLTIGVRELHRLSSLELCYVEIANHQLRYYTTRGEFCSTGSLRELEKRLQGEPFARCNNCYLVNLSHVSGLKKDIVLVGGHELKISRPRKKAFLQALTEYYGGGGR